MEAVVPAIIKKMKIKIAVSFNRKISAKIFKARISDKSIINKIAIEYFLVLFSPGVIKTTSYIFKII